MTRKQLCELIQRRLAGGNVPDDFSPKIEEINYWIEHGVAYSAMKNYTDNVNAADIEFVSDAFYTTFYDISLSEVQKTKELVGTIPSIPYGLPRGHDIISASVSNGSGERIEMMRLTLSQASYFKKFKYPSNSVFYWVEGNKIYVTSKYILTDYLVIIKMASSVGDAGLDSELNCPPDLIMTVVDYVTRQFVQPVQKDLSNDGVQVN